VFLKILDSSIAEDFTVRHIFEDFLKLCNHKTGIVDMTRQALARRLNVPMEILNGCIEKLEASDPNSRDDEYDGRRLERLDEHRDWGWKILNWEKYESLRTKADVYLRVSKHREKNQDLTKFQKPVVEEVKLYASEIQMPMQEAEKLFNYYESNGWRVGKNPMKDWKATVRYWKRTWQEKQPKNGSTTVGGRF